MQFSFVEKKYFLQLGSLFRDESKDPSLLTPTLSVKTRETKML